MTTFANLYSADEIYHGAFEMNARGITFNGVVLSNDDIVGLMTRSPAFRTKIEEIVTAIRDFSDSGEDLKPGDVAHIGFGLCIRKAA